MFGAVHHLVLGVSSVFVSVVNFKEHVSIHLSNVLTNHFSNSHSEKTTNDIHMKFLRCHFKTTFYRLPLPNRGSY